MWLELTTLSKYTQLSVYNKTMQRETPWQKTLALLNIRHEPVILPTSAKTALLQSRTLRANFSTSILFKFEPWVKAEKISLCVPAQLQKITDLSEIVAHLQLEKENVLMYVLYIVFCWIKFQQLELYKLEKSPLQHEVKEIDFLW